MIKGEILQIAGKVWFRQYDKNGAFIDYKIVANDFSIQIDDNFITLIKTGEEEGILDYTDAVLGRVK